MDEQEENDAALRAASLLLNKGNDQNPIILALLLLAARKERKSERLLSKSKDINNEWYIKSNFRSFQAAGVLESYIHNHDQDVWMKLHKITGMSSPFCSRHEILREIRSTIDNPNLMQSQLGLNTNAFNKLNCQWPEIGKFKIEEAVEPFDLAKIIYVLLIKPTLEIEFVDNYDGNSDVSRIDLYTFLFATQIEANQKIATKNEANRRLGIYGPKILPYAMMEDLCTRFQAEWWKAVYEVKCIYLITFFSSMKYLNFMITGLIVTIKFNVFILLD